MNIAKTLTASSHRLPDDVLGELIDQMFNTLDSVLFMGVAFLVMAVLIATRLSDPYVLALGVGGFICCLGWAAVIFRYRRRTAHHALSRQEAKAWERAYGGGACAFSLVFALFFIRVMAVGDAVCHM